MAIRICGAAVLLFAVCQCTISGIARERPLFDERPPQQLGELEAVVANHPDDPEQTMALAQLYLQAGQPGLAVVLVQGAQPAVRNDVRVEHVYTRALMDQGRNDVALVTEKRVVESCHGLAEGGSAPAGCDAVLLATAIRRTGILYELLSLGVEDVRAQPEASLVAYQNATREARMVVQ